MTRFVAAVICSWALVLATPAQASAPTPLPALTRIASGLSGIAARHRVRVVHESAAGMRAQATRVLDRDYPPDQQDYDQTVYRALGLLAPDEALRPFVLAAQPRDLPALYDPVRRVLYLRSGRIARAAVVRELVHALQDQAFDLRRLSRLHRGSGDAAAAAEAAVDGDATLATRVLGGRVEAFAPRRVTLSGPPIVAFLGLERDFPSATGLHFAATLHNLGGNRAVFSALRTFPVSTKQVFHVDAFLTREQPAAIELPAAAGGFSLLRADTFGELDLRALLATFQVPGLDRAAAGWTGGRTGVYRDAAGRTAVALDLSWESPLDAAQWGEALAVYVNEAFDAETPGFPPTVSCPATTCWAVGDRGIAFRRAGASSVLVLASSVAAATAVAASVNLK